MKILVATHQTQGQRKNDFAWVDDGEPVVPAFTCDGHAGRPDGQCGCGRAFAGTASLKSTTTAIVAETGDPNALTEAITGWYKAFFCVEDLDGDLLAAVAQDTADMARAAAAFPAGTVVERRGRSIQARREPAWCPCGEEPRHTTRVHPTATGGDPS